MGKDLEQLFKESGLSLKEIAEYTGLNIRTIKQYAKGNLNRVNTSKIFLLAKVLKLGVPEVAEAFEVSIRKYNKSIEKK